MACFSLEKKLLGDRALDQDAFMPRNRLVARGNATTFPLAWEDLLQNMQDTARQAEEGQLQLPRIGSELKAIVNVILKAGKANENVLDTAKIIHQARVRRSIVVGLVLDAKARDHPAYRSLEESDVYQRAATLPEDGVPTEIIALLPEDNNLQDIQRQKAATPYRDNMTEDQLQQEFATMCKPNAVVGERTSAGFGDINAQQVSALEAIASQTTAQADVENSLIMHTGNRVLDQFEPWYFAFAFSYVFPYGCGMPDPPTWSPKQRCRSGTDAPRVELAAWMRCMARRCEAQINRDWVFGFSVWNLYFRSALNLSKSFNNYHLPVYDETQQSYRTLTPADIEAGARQLVTALGGTYVDVRGQQKAVNGDVTKLAYVRNLKPAARKMLQQMRGAARAIPGTSEARRQMRFEIQAMRVTYGTPIFITISPDEAHQWLFVRMSRARASDPVRLAHPLQEWQCGDRNFPPFLEKLSYHIMWYMPFSIYLGFQVVQMPNLQKFTDFHGHGGVKTLVFWSCFVGPVAMIVQSFDEAHVCFKRQRRASTLGNQYTYLYITSIPI